MIVKSDDLEIARMTDFEIVRFHDSPNRILWGGGNSPSPVPYLLYFRLTRSSASDDVTGKDQFHSAILQAAG